MRCPLCDQAEVSFGICSGCLATLDTGRPRPDALFTIVVQAARLLESGQVEEMARRCYARGYVVRYPAMGRSIKRDDMMRTVAQLCTAADLRLTGRQLGYDTQERLWVASELLVKPRDGRPAIPSRQVGAYRREGDKIAESWHWIDERPRISADELSDQLRRLGSLKQAGALNDDEFSDKKADLLARI